MEQHYLILDDDSKNIAKIRSLLGGFQGFIYSGAASTFSSAVDLILETLPDLVFLEIQPEDKNSGLSLSIISECHRLLTKLPVFITFSSQQDLALQALRYGAIDFLPKPFEAADFRRAWFRYAKDRHIPLVSSRKIDISSQEMMSETFEQEDSILPDKISYQEASAISLEPVLQEIKSLREALLQFSSKVPTIQFDADTLTQHLTSTIKEVLPETFATDIQNTIQQFRKSLLTTEGQDRPVTVPLTRNVICIKSYGDYRFLELNEIAFLKADNNSTDITLSNGELVTAFKTLKYFEENLPENFYRIHNSYMVNRDFISRIHTGNSECYIKDSKIKVPFSKGYKEKVEQIIEFLAGSDIKEV